MNPVVPRVRLHREHGASQCLANGKQCGRLKWGSTGCRANGKKHNGPRVARLQTEHCTPKLSRQQCFLTELAACPRRRSPRWSVQWRTGSGQECACMFACSLPDCLQQVFPMDLLRSRHIPPQEEMEDRREQLELGGHGGRGKHQLMEGQPDGQPQSCFTIHLVFLLFGFTISCTRIVFIKKNSIYKLHPLAGPSFPQSLTETAGNEHKAVQGPCGRGCGQTHSCGWFSGLQEPWQPQLLPWRPQGTRSGSGPQEPLAQNNLTPVPFHVNRECRAVSGRMRASVGSW